MLASTFSGSPCKSFVQELWNKKNNNHKDGGLTCIFFAIWCLSNFLMGDQNQITFSNVSIGVLSAMASTIYTESSFIYLQNLIYFLKPLIMLLFVSMTSEASQHTQANKPNCWQSHCIVYTRKFTLLPVVGLGLIEAWLFIFSENWIYHD